MNSHDINMVPAADTKTGMMLRDSAELMNSECACTSLDDTALDHALEVESGVPGLGVLIQETCPHLFSARPVFIAEQHLQRMAQVIRAIETVVAMPAWREKVLASAPTLVRHDPGGAQGVLFGYDFHIWERGPELIEINTNAGGVMLNAMLARAQRACCPEMEAIIPDRAVIDELERHILEMFLREWLLAGRSCPLRSIAIVDETPQQQYLYPEFLLFQQLFQRHGLTAVIADPAELVLRDDALWYGDIQVDLVYNRLTDFLLEHPVNAALRQAYLDHAVVLTPHPQAHALYADKRNLALLTDADALEALGVPQPVQVVLLACIPPTEIVDAAHAERLWRTRRQLFFKPAAGYGSRAAYRGDKLTRRVWQDILAGDYVAQALAPPGERVIHHDDAQRVLKFDVRNYVYDGNVQWVAARLYQGQTTNFRTPGGGFAPVYGLPVSVGE